MAARQVLLLRNLLTRILLLAALWFAPARAAAEPDSSLSARLVQTAMLIQAREQDVLDSETRLDELKLRRRSQLARFDRQRGELTQLLTALQRLGRQPPSLMLVRTHAAIEQVRGATLLGAVIQTVEQEAAVLREDLAEIDQLETIMTKERELVMTRLRELQSEQQRLTGLLAEQNGQQSALIEAAAAKAGAMAALAKSARDTGDLLARLENQSGGREAPAGAPRAKPPLPSADAAGQSDAESQVALLSPAAPGARQLMRFSAARGRLAIPARGKIVANFGAKDPSGARRRGMSIRTRESAEVIAPFDGKIVFAGPFRAYGQLMILEAGEGYHILLSGMSLLHGVVGQNVTKGQPVGRMGTGPKGDAAVQAAPEGGPDLRDLYVEFRKDGKPFNPMPWLEVSEKKVSG